MSFPCDLELFRVILHSMNTISRLWKEMDWF